jgi:3-oxoacyl-[acyl-carrier protein] reductase/pteridine reductase
VSKKFNGKPIMNAAVVFDSTLNGKEEGNLEVKTDPDGKAVIDVIPTGSKVRVQIIATGFATYAEDYLVTEPTRQIFVSMLRPQEQISAYENNEGKATERKPGVQEPIRTTAEFFLSKRRTTAVIDDNRAINSMDKLLTGKTALVTGAAKRIGRAIALALAENGANVAITYLGSQSDSEETVRALAALDVDAFSVRCDLRDPLSIEQMVAAVADEFGQIDLLVNNAGMFASEALENISAEQWDAMFTTNTRAPFLVAKAAYPHLHAAKGRIVNIGSLGGIHPWATHAHYCTSKAALHMLSQTMAKAWAPAISVNCIAPGMIVQGEVDEAYAHFAQKTPMQRNGTAEDVAAAAVFFATAPHFITGQLLAVDGGLGL